ncbi:hypothetical protein U1Q18_028988 [Sarracenia purpurea var. burkii]
MAMEKRSESTVVVSIGLIIVSVVVFGSAAAVGGATIAEKCSTEIEKVAKCLNYASGKAATPTKDCCSSVEEIKASQPECLCYFIQQAHNGSQQIESMGIQESRLLQLPSACKLTNASVSECPKLLNIPTSSPDYAIFTNSSTSSTTPTTSTGTSLPTSAGDPSRWTRHGSQFARLVSIATTISLCSLPTQLVSTFHFYPRG